MVTRRPTTGCEQGEPLATALVEQPAVALVDRLEPEPIGVEPAGPLEVLGGQPGGDRTVLQDRPPAGRRAMAFAPQPPVLRGRARSAGRGCRPGPARCRTTRRRPRGTPPERTTVTCCRVSSAATGWIAGTVKFSTKRPGSVLRGPRSSCGVISTATGPKCRKPSGSAIPPSVSTYQVRSRSGSVLASRMLSSGGADMVDASVHSFGWVPVGRPDPDPELTAVRPWSVVGAQCVPFSCATTQMCCL